MKSKILLGLLFLAAPAFAQTDHVWILQQSTLTYHVSHPLHQSEGVSHEAKGKGVCHDEQCDFLVAVPVKSFNSGDSNRDLHMLQATSGAEFPLFTLRTRLPETVVSSTMVQADLQVQFAGQTAEYKQVSLQLVEEDDNVRITGTVPATLSDFKIDPPSLLAIPVKNAIPVRVETTWREQK